MIAVSSSTTTLKSLRSDSIIKSIEAFTIFMHVLFGVYMSVLSSVYYLCMLLILSRWEMVISLDFDCKFLCGRQRFRWPLVT